LPYVKYNKGKKLTQFVKLENIEEMFFDASIHTDIQIDVDDGSYCIAKYNQETNLAEIEINLENQKVTYELYGNLPSVEMPISEGHTLNIDNKLSIFHPYKKRDYPSPKVRYFKFPHSFSTKEQDPLIKISGLIPPHGINLFDMAQKDPLKQELSKLFQEYRLKLLFDKTSHTLRIVKELDDNSLVSLPFNSMADTLQRIVFFKAAIASNTNSILLFEEPEAHCFPPYIAHITQEIIAAQTNQFFIATHSPYVLNAFLEQSRDELAVFIVDYRDGQTVINRLTDAELNEVYDYGIDVFFNYERFTQHG